MPDMLIRDSLVATGRTREQARDFTNWIEQHRDSPDSSARGDIQVPEELSNLLVRALNIIADGGSVSIGSLPEMLTTTVAADVLGVSRTTLMKMVAANELDHTKIGSHTRLKRDDVFEFRRRRLQQQREALDRLLELEDELGL